MNINNHSNPQIVSAMVDRNAALAELNEEEEKMIAIFNDRKEYILMQYRHRVLCDNVY